MKNSKYYFFVPMVAFVYAIGWASTIVYSNYIVNNPALAVSGRHSIDLKTAGRNGRSIDTLAAQVVYASATISAVQFTDGSVSTGAVTVTNSGLVGVQASNTITVASTSSLLNAILVINGKQLRQGYDWRVKSSTNATATDIARIMNYVAGIHAAATGNIVYATATTAGTAGNSYTLTKISASNLTIANPTFTGGINNAYVKINGITLRQGTDWMATDTASGTAKAISDAIMANTSLNQVIASTWTSGVVYTTSTHVGANVNYALVGSPSNKLTVSAATMTGGTASAYTVDTGVITKTSHHLTDVLPVLYSTGGFTLGGLTNQTTYYAIKVSDNAFKLATTSTGAIAGNYITLTSSSIAGPHTWTLTPLSFSGTWGMKWQVSDDNSTWDDLSVSSITFASPYTASSAVWDFGDVGHRYIGVFISTGGNGGWNIQVVGTGRNNN